MRLSSFVLVLKNDFQQQECRVLPGPGPELQLHHRGGSASAANQDTSPAQAQRRKAGLGIKILFVFAPCVRTSVQWIDELSFHHAFIGPLDLNAEFLELAVKRGSCETQDVGAFFYIAAGAFECLHDRFTLNLPHRH